jgi:hypothetical protein
MGKRLVLSNNEGIVFLLLVIATFIKVIYNNAVYYSKYFIKTNLGENIYKFIRSTKKVYASSIDMLYVIVGIYFIFIKKSKNIILTSIFSLLIFKALMHFLVAYKLYRNLNLSLENEKKFLEFKSVLTRAMNVVLFFLTLYILKIIFI